MAQSITLSSLGTAAMVLNPVSRSTTVMLTVTGGTSLSVVTVEMSLDDPTIPGGPTTTWSPLSSGAAMLSSALTSGLVYTVLSPIGQVRINSSLNTSTVYTLKTLQAVSA